MYELDVPQPFTVTFDNLKYEIKVRRVIKEQCHLFHCITSYEDYEYVLEQYVKNQTHMFSNEAKVLVLYYDEQLGLHVTMPIRVSIEEVDNEVLMADASYWANRRVKSYQAWQHK